MTVTGAVPVVDRTILTKLLQGWLPAADGDPRPLVLVQARYSGGEREFSVQVPSAAAPTRTYRVVVSDQPSVLGVVDAWHRRETAAPHDVLVVTTSADEGALGWELRAQAFGRKVWPVERAALVRSRFQAPESDPRIAVQQWLVDGLLAAEPTSGWKPVGGVLTWDAAVAALVCARLGLDADRRDGWDVTGLLDWSLRPGAGDRFAELSPQERDGISTWLGERIGSGATLLLALAGAGRARDAVPLGVVSSLAAVPHVPAEAAMALGALLGGVPHRPAELRALAGAVAGTLSRWVTEAAQTREPLDSEPGLRVLGVLRRADELAAGAGLAPALAGHSLLPAALDHQLRDLADAFAVPHDPTAPTAHDVRAAEIALDVVARHQLTSLDPRRLDVARTAVRLQRWLASPVGHVTAVGDASSRHLADWGWADRALDLVWAGDPGGDPVVGAAYRRVHDAARARRDRLDEEFAGRLVAWAAHACTQQPAGALLVEDVLPRVVAPLVRRDLPAPLIVVVDGMSSAVAVQFADSERLRTWAEVSPERGRRAAAISMLPSLTRVSRASLLSGQATSGDADREKDGFAAFWRSRGREGRLFHKGDLVGRAGQRLSDDVVAALAGDAVVGVVLNTVDDALDHGQEGDRSGWTLRRVTYLPELLDAAQNYGRPVVLTSDHGHVLDRSAPGEGPTTTEGADAARWRVGTAGVGEVEVSGPRVLAGGGRIVLPWRETVRYTPRKAGYHGGASLAEVTVPVLVLLPDAERLPAGWSVLIPDELAPAWWTGRVPEPAVADLFAADLFAAAMPEPRRRKAPEPQTDALFELAEVGAEVARTARPATTARSSGLGRLVVASEVYEAQKAFVRKALDAKDVARVVDALAASSGTLPLATVATLVGRAGRRSEQIVTLLQRLLNVEGFEVVTAVDGGRTVRLDVGLLREQFGLGEQA